MLLAPATALVRIQSSRPISQFPLPFDCRIPGAKDSLPERLRSTWATGSGSVRSAVPSVKCFGSLLNIFGPDKQIGSGNSWIHAPGIIGPDHRLDPGFV
jgi:hypothetical protein